MFNIYEFSAIISFNTLWIWNFKLTKTVLLSGASVLGFVGANSLPGLRIRRDSFPDAFQLPSNASLVLGNIITGFDCNDLPYGYYADEANNCQVFHICLPYIDHDVYTVRMFSFLCGEGTVFDQVSNNCKKSYFFKM